ncbi:MAG: hypothetical protein HN736_01940 [Anaerolineae bacterium]|jgi:hypothetical protein|nr:hypothetical protein [Anaerolineae bacterium]MBT4309453.1 hypothetical protein [Anaerolineae bacterium]MBT4458271.1 hypothetical protein [Anaerolineae bacterium]MBT4840974.1 hypothetical protein [Anaerolineae bacterium]MBT6061152.1 hypothetical protein [Anaerolineae bacterium]
MTLRVYFLLFFLALALAIGVASFQSTPGYMDADYYYATGIQLAQGDGYTESFLWNYLDDPDGLPHPSHAYWMPLTSILSALGMRLARGFEFASAQWVFILLSALIPLITASLAYSFTSRRDLSIISAFLALFSGYYAPFLTTTDTFTLYILLGGSFVLALKIRRIWLRALILGIIAALMHLSRADGAIWLIIAAISLFTLHVSRSPNSRFPIINSFLPILSSFVFLFSAYLLITAPWFFRNFKAFGTILAPGGNQALWLTSYNQIFAYPAGNLSLESWLASGWSAIVDARLWAFKLNLGTILGVQSGMILLPFIILGAWHYRKNEILRVGIFTWLITFFVMTFIFPFAGARGGFFHSGAALQPLWWALAPVGLDRAIAWMVKNRGWREESHRVFQMGLVVALFFITAAIFEIRVLSPFARKQAQSTGVPLYTSIEKILSEQSGDNAQAVIVSNPPGYFLASNRLALALPDGNIEALFDIATRYNAGYLILEPGGVTDGLMPVFDAPTAQPNLIFLDEMEGAKIFVIKTE